ncbi:DUF1893 domain-containing protein [Calditrichota bacterium GD2]
MIHSLEVYKGNELIFASDRHWLHPLFELERFLNANSYQTAELLVKDKIIGRAAALILVYFGFKKMQGQTMSLLAREVLDYYKIDYTFERLIERVACQTEELLRTEWESKTAYQLIKRRIESRQRRM